MRITYEQTQRLPRLNGGDCRPLLQSTVHRAGRHGIDDTEIEFVVNYGRAAQFERNQAAECPSSNPEPPPDPDRN